MKDQSITLRKFIETFSVPSFSERMTHNIPENFNELSYSEKYKLIRASDIVYVLSVKDGHIFYGVKDIVVVRYGNKIFIESEKFIDCIWIDNKGIKICMKSPNAFSFIDKFLDLCNITWHKELSKHTCNFYLSKSSILRAVLTKKVYNQKTLYKFIAKRIFGNKDISWKNCRNYCENPRNFSLLDLAAFTKNINDSLEVICNPISDTNLLRDLLTYAIQLNEVVDFKWSEKRMREEHQRQIHSVELEKIESTEVVPIYDNVFGTDTIKMLNTERDVYLEGISMDHCLYRCYYDRIANHNYIAFHMTSPEDCTFSVCKRDDKIVFDQIYLSHDRPVQENTRLLAQQFIKDREQDILKCFKEPVNNEMLSYSDVFVF